jgi:hypothetical protein
MRKRVLTVLATLAALAACSADAPPTVEPSGFLGDYSQLEKGRGDQAQLVYINPEAHFAGYDKLLIEPVVVWQAGQAAPAGPSAKELQGLADDLGAALRRQLQLEFRLVDDPGPGTLQLRAAITAVREPDVSIELELLDAASGERLVAVADARGDARDGGAGERGWTSVHEAFDFWASRARARLAAFRRFDAAEAAHEAAAEP